MKFCLTYILLYIILQGYAQTPNFRNYTVADGLVETKVYAITQDKNGYLWFGTSAGLSRFDGLTFKSFTRKNGLSSNNIRALEYDNRGSLWICTIGGGVCLIGSSGQISIYKKKDGLCSDTVYAILVDSKGIIWVGCKGGISKYDPRQYSKPQFVNFKMVNDFTLNDKTVTCIFEDSRGNIWFGARSLKSGALIKYNEDGFFLINEGRAITSILENETSEYLWIGTWGGEGIYKYYFDEKSENVLSKIDIETVKVNNNGLAPGATWAIEQGSHGDIWFATNTTGLWKYENRLFDHIAPLLSRSIIYDIFKDREGNLWFATHSDGIWMKSIIPFSSFTEENGLSNNNITAILEDKKGIIWFGTHGGGVSKLDNKEFSSFNYYDGFHDIVWSIIEDSYDILWFTTDYDVYRYDGLNFKVDFSLLSKDGGMVYCAFEDSKSNLWFGTRDVGAIQYRRSDINDCNGQVTYYVSDTSLLRMEVNTLNYYQTSLGSNVVYTIVEDLNNNLWFGTTGGLTKYDGNSFTNYTIKNGLADNVVHSLVIDKYNYIWIGTAEGGVCYIDPKNANKKGQIFTRLSDFERLNSGSINSLIIDDLDNLWIGTNEGLFQFSLPLFHEQSKVLIKYFGKHDGFKGVECNRNSVYKDNNDGLWFGTVKGAFHFDLNRFYQNNVGPLTHISNVRLLWGDTINNFNPILNYKQNAIAFDFIGISMTNPGKVQYSYKLEGNDDQWSPSTFINSATYTNLNPGRYVFKVISSNNDGIWNKQPASFSFAISPPYWQTWWFRTIVALLSLIVLIAFFYILIKRQQKKQKIEVEKIRKEEQERREEEVRKRQLEELKRKISDLDHKAFIARMKPHFVTNFMNFIRVLIQNNDVKTAVENLTKFELLTKLIFENAEGSFITLSNEIEMLRLYLEISKVCNENIIEFDFKIDPELDIENSEIPPMLLQPLIENSIKHGFHEIEYKGKLSLTFENKDTGFICIVEDNGIGRKKSSEFNPNNLQKASKESSALFIIQERLDNLNKRDGSSFNIGITDLFNEEKKPQGTRVELYIPND